MTWGKASAKLWPKYFPVYTTLSAIFISCVTSARISSNRHIAIFASACAATQSVHAYMPWYGKRGDISMSKAPTRRCWQKPSKPPSRYKIRRSCPLLLDLFAGVMVFARQAQRRWLWIPLRPPAAGVRSTAAGTGPALARTPEPVPE